MLLVRELTLFHLKPSPEEQAMVTGLQTSYTWMMLAELMTMTLPLGNLRSHLKRGCVLQSETMDVPTRLYPTLHHTHATLNSPMHTMPDTTHPALAYSMLPIIVSC